MRFFVISLFFFTNILCLQQVSINGDPISESQSLIPGNFILDEDRENHLYCGDKRCCDSWEGSIRCLCPRAFDADKNCKVSRSERNTLYKVCGCISCLLAGVCTWGWATQGCPPWSVPG